jgi:hypothetical protein
MAHPKIFRRYASLKDGVALVFDGTAKTKAAVFHWPERGSSRISAF